MKNGAIVRLNLKLFILRLNFEGNTMTIEFSSENSQCHTGATLNYT